MRVPPKWVKKIKALLPLTLQDTAYALGILLSAVLLCFALRNLDTGSTYASMVFLLAVVLISRLTDGYFYGITSSFVAMFAVNYIYTYPYFAFNFTIPGYPVTFVSMLVVSVIVSTLTTRLKEQEKIKAAAEREKIKGNLLRAVSHDLRTPLTSILGASSVMLENGETLTPEKQRELLINIRHEAEWLIRMVENLLSITRFQADAAQIIKREEAVEEVVGEAVRKFRDRYDTLAICVTVPDELFLVPMDPMLIEQIIINLLENARKHGKTATRVDLCVRKERSFALFEVCDNGVGIPPHKLPTLFDGYLQEAAKNGDASRNMGVGLSVCMSIVQAHGGMMEAENMAAGGSCFRFRLPL